jgi:hypothetical protein
MRQLVMEELAKIDESVDHKSINSIVTVASKLLAAIETFKEKAPHAALNAVTPHVSELENVLENMLSSPGSYVPKQRIEPKRISLKSTKGGK